MEAAVADKTKTNTLVRLRKIEGQIRGLQKMIEEDKPCAEVVHQLCAARKALDKVGFLMLSHRMQECLRDQKAAGGDKEMAEAMKLFLTLA